MSLLAQVRCPRRGRPAAATPTVAEVIERFAPAFQARYGARITVDQRRALQAILQCRTAVLGGHRYACDCGHEHHAFHSCNHRLCPRCGADDAANWVAKQLGKLLPVPYYMVTFTLPQELRSLFLGNRAAMELLMRHSSQALAELLADPARCGFHRNGFFGVYQSWSQDLRFHPHVHYIVPAVGLDPKWHLKRPKSPRFLLYADPLAKRLRTLLTNALHHHGLISKSLFWTLVKMQWNASVDPAGSGENAVKYLGRYIRRSVIADSRIIAIEADKVRIRVKNRDQGTTATRLIPGVEFVRRFLLHALPPRFHRIRYRGFMHARAKATLQRLQLILETRLQPDPQPHPAPQPTPQYTCPRCGTIMRRIGTLPRAPPARRNQSFFHTLAA